MATYTSKLNLKKPAQTDFYNIDDFNGNADKVDAFASTSNLKTFTDLTQIGLTLGSETIESIASALPENSMLFISVGSASNKNIYPAYTSGARYGVLRVTKRETDRILFEFFYLPDSATQYTRYWMGLYSSTWYGWVEVISEKGGNLTGALYLNGIGAIQQFNSTVEIISRVVGSSTDDRIHFAMNANEDIANALVLAKIVNNVAKTYKVYGEHNLPNVARIQTGSYVGTNTYNKSNPCILNFGFQPKFVFISAYSTETLEHHTATLVFNAPNSMSFKTVYSTSNAYRGGYELSVIWGDKSVQWYNTSSAVNQLNSNAYTYYYVAIG